MLASRTFTSPIAMGLALAAHTSALHLPHTERAAAKRLSPVDCYVQTARLALFDGADTKQAQWYVDRGTGDGGAFGWTQSNHMDGAGIFRIEYCDNDPTVTVICPVSLRRAAPTTRCSQPPQDMFYARRRPYSWHNR